MERITVLLADDSLIIRQGVGAMLAMDPALEVVGLAVDYETLVAEAIRLAPQVVVTDIRMPPHFDNEGIDGAKEIRKRLPGTGIVILSQFDDPEYAVALLAEGSDGYAYLLKDQVADASLLGQAIRTVAVGGSLLDPSIVTDLLSPARAPGDLSAAEDDLLQQIAEGRSIKTIATSRGEDPAATDAVIERLFLDLARRAGGGRQSALRQLRLLHTAITSREEQGETLSRMLPGGLAEKLRTDPAMVGRTDKLVVTVLMSDVRGYSGIAEITDPAVLAGQLNAHRRAMNAAVLQHGGTVMQYVGDAVMAVFGAPNPLPHHAAAAVRAAQEMHARQGELDRAWAGEGLAPFGLGIGLSTGEVAAVVLGSEERLEYSMVGDTVNLAARLQDLARPAGTTVAAAATVTAVEELWPWVSLGLCPVKGRAAAVEAFSLTAG